jgi:hypothetical protein
MLFPLACVLNRLGIEEAIAGQINRMAVGACQTAGRVVAAISR